MTVLTIDTSLILSITFLALRTVGVPVLERQLLEAARTNQCGYLTCYRAHEKALPSAGHLLRPSTVPQKNKWLRDQACELGASLRVQQSVRPELYLAVVLEGMKLQAFDKPSRQILQQIYEHTESVFDAVGCILMAINLTVGQQGLHRVADHLKEDATDFQPIWTLE